MSVKIQVVIYYFSYSKLITEQTAFNLFPFNPNSNKIKATPLFDVNDLVNINHNLPSKSCIKE